MVGEHDWTDHGETVHTVYHDVDKIHVNGFVATTLSQDNAIIILKVSLYITCVLHHGPNANVTQEKIVLNGPGAHRICLPVDLKETYAHVRFNATGWGRLSLGGQQPELLQEVELKALRNKK